MIYIMITFTVLIVVLLIKAVLFKPQCKTIEKLPMAALDQTKILERFSKLIQFRTISHLEEEKFDVPTFKGFQESLREMYPNITNECYRELIGYKGILYKWQGKEPGSVTVLMSHYDVVPANEKYWSIPPFEGIIKDGAIWGRGTLDTKISLLSIMEAAEKLIGENFTPKHDIYFSFAGDEEVSGNTAPTIVKLLEEREIFPELVVDEGGVVINQLFPGVDKKIALIGTCEKGYVDLLIKGTSLGGHSSAPPYKTLSQDFAKAIISIERNNLKGTFIPPVKELFDRVGRYSTFTYRLLFGNMWLFEPLLKLMFKKKGGQMNAFIRTTMAVTKIEGSKAFNVLPPEGSIGVNCRLLNNMTSDEVVDYIKGRINNANFSFEKIESREASPTTATNTPEFKLMEDVINGIWPEAIVSPYLMTAGTDSRHFNKICKNVMRFSPIDITSEELSLIHSNDERIKIESVMKSVQFYYALIKRL